MKKALSVLVTDLGFIVPSMLLAEQLSSPSLKKLTDVMVFVLDVPANLVDKLRKGFETSALTIVPLLSRDFKVSSEYARYFQGHVPLAAVARLEIADLLPREYDNIVYFDGDMQIVGNIEALFAQQIPDGHIAAAAENFIMLEGSCGERPDWLERYLSDLQLRGAASYFNSGLMLFRRETWQRIAPSALQYFLENPGKCKHHDQSSLNAVCKEQWLPLSPAYNYLTFYLKMGGRERISPKIVHFCSSPKPWQSPKSPWHPRYADNYRTFLAKHADLKDLLNVYEAGATPGMLYLLKRDVKLRAKALLKTPHHVSNFTRYVRETEFLLH